jgi:hypothetical protein
MNSLLKLTAAAVALAGLTACDALGLNRNESAAGNDAANAAAENTADANAAGLAAGGKDPAAGGATPASAPFTGQVTTAFLIGRWTDNEDCTKTIEFRDDGKFVTADGGQGMWVLTGDQLTFQGQSSITAQVSAPNPDTIMLRNADGSVGRSTRCN